MRLSLLVPLRSRQIQSKYLDRVNEIFKTLNHRIETYNALLYGEEKFQALQQLYRLFCNLGHLIPQQAINESTTYQQLIQKRLFSELKYEFQRFQVQSMNNALKSNPYEKIPISFTLSEIIANLESNHAAQLLTLLSSGAQFDIKELRTLANKLGDQRDNFRLFLDNHSIKYLGGFNSVIYEVTSALDGSSHILKIEKTLQDNKQAEDYFRNNSLADVMSKVYVERQVSSQSKSGEQITRNLIVLENMTLGTLEQYGKTMTTPDKKIMAALTMFERMSHILMQLTLQDKGLFPDMKIINWMVDEHENLRISDGKSLCLANHCNERLNTIDIIESSDFHLILSNHLIAPEMYYLSRTSASVEKIHGYFMGKLIYQFLTECSDEEIKADSARRFNFNYPLFQLPMGKLLQKLIIKLVIDAPALRPTLSAINKQLLVMQHQLPCYQLVDQIAAFSISKSDITMKRFISSLNAMIEGASDLDSLQAMQRQMTIHKETLSSNHDFFKELMEQIERIKQLPHGKERARELEQALYAIPVLERSELTNQPNSRQVIHFINLFNSPITPKEKRPLEPDEETLTGPSLKRPHNLFQPATRSQPTQSNKFVYVSIQPKQ